MKNLLFFTSLFGLLFIMISSATAIEMSSASYTITTQVISGGGGPVESLSGNYKGNFTIGQPSPLMDQNTMPAPPESASNTLYPGFWYTLSQGCPGDQEPDGDVDGADVAAFINTGDFSSLEAFASFFGTMCQ